MAWVTPTNVATGDVLTASKWNQDVVENTSILYASRRLGYVTRDTAYTVNQTSVASAADIFSSSITFTADGTSTYWVEFYSTRITLPAATNGFTSGYLTNGTSTTFGRMFLAFNNANVQIMLPVHVKVPLVPSSGSVTLNMRGTVSTGSCTYYGDTPGGGADDEFPMWMAVYGPDVS